MATHAWRSTAGRPLRRAGAAVVALAVLAGVAWAWWPQGDRYRPIQSYEGGTLLDALPAAAPTGLTAGLVARATTVWPAGEQVPTSERPALAVVLVPHDAQADSAAGAPTSGEELRAGDPETADPGTWVFPFNRPPAPAEGDNQALAVNTEDGSTVYDVAFALVWAEDGVADNVNSAYALASCTGCTTVAVAFQVVLVLGQSDVVPQNLAAAVNYSCVACVTGALAQQLVVTLDGPLSAASQRELENLWARIADYGTTLEGRSLAEIRAQLSEFEREILAVLGIEATGVAGATPTTSPTGSPSGPASPDPIDDSTAAPPTGTATDTSAPVGTGTGSTGAAGPTPAPPSDGPTPTQAPSPSATESPGDTGSSTAEPSPSSSSSP